MLLILLVVLIVFGCGGGYYAHGQWGGNGLIGVVVLCLLIALLFGGLGHFGYRY